MYLQALGTFSKGSSPQLCGSPSLCPVHFRVRGLIRLVRKGMESHLSCQIQLCAPLASKSREIFHFPLFSVGFRVFVCVCSSPLFFFPPPVTLLPMFIPFSPPSCYYPLLVHSLSFFVPRGCGWRSLCTLAHFHRERRGERAREKRTRGTAKIGGEGEGQPGGQAVHSALHSSLFAFDMIGEVWKDVWG